MKICQIYKFWQLTRKATKKKLLDRKSLASRRNTFKPSDDESRDEEEKIIEIVYLTQGNDKDDGENIGEHAYSKATHISIDGFTPRKSLTTVEPDDSGDESDCIIIEESESVEFSEQPVEIVKAAPASASPKDSIIIDSGNEVSTKQFSIEKEMSKSPKNLNVSQPSPLEEKISSTLSPKDVLYDEAVGGVEAIKVSPSQYKEMKAKKDNAETQVNEMLKLLEHAEGLPDRG